MGEVPKDRRETSRPSPEKGDPPSQDYRRVNCPPSPSTYCSSPLSSCHLSFRERMHGSLGPGDRCGPPRKALVTAMLSGCSASRLPKSLLHRLAGWGVGAERDPGLSPQGSSSPSRTLNSLMRNRTAQGEEGPLEVSSGATRTVTAHTHPSPSLVPPSPHLPAPSVKRELGGLGERLHIGHGARESAAWRPLSKGLGTATATRPPS